MKFVLDNSISTRWLFGDGSTEDQDYALHILSQMNTGRAEAVVPGIWALEMANVMARGQAKSILSEARCKEFLSLIERMNITEDPLTFANSFSRSLPLARDYSLSAYDASYLELSLRLKIPLATLDQDLRKALRKTHSPLL